uniref:GAG-pre-integrase domain-containing protein n=1 Tax=Chenopodium quinoa TaxID=63459 RepID=A0A803M8T8_CHEQI
MVQEAQTGRIIGSGTERGGLYFLDEATQHGNALLAHGSPEYQLWMWHRRLGHPSVGYLKRLFPSFKNIDVTLDCESCALAKSHKHTYSPSLTHAIKPFMLIHSDVWGPAPEFAIHNFSYFVLFVDDCTRMSWPGPQGETSSDDLSWLTYPEVMDLEDPTTQVDSTTDVASPEVTVPSSPLQSTPDSPTEHPTEDVVISSEVNTENSDLCDLPITDPVVPSENCPNRYELPPRRTRGVPPKRYDPEYEDSRSRYPIGKISNENLASNAIAFTASLYSTEIPKTVEEALASKDWRKAMEDEYLALEKNETWEK